MKNILALGIIYDGMAFPIVFKMMDKRGNRFIRLAGWLFNGLKLGESKHLDGIYYVNGQACWLSGSKSRTRMANPSCKSSSHTAMQRKPWRCTNSGGKWNVQGNEIERLRYRRLRAVSLFKYGLDYIFQCLVHHTNRYRIDVFKFLSYT